MQTSSDTEKSERRSNTLQIVNSILNSSNATTFPIDLNKIADYLGNILGLEIIIQEKALAPTLSGTIVKVGSTVGILVNNSHNEHRKRFTIAHELGHLALKHELDLKYYEEKISTGTKSPYEVEANQFATELLMPKKQIIDFIKSTKIHKVSELAARINVSEETLWYKIDKDKIDKYLI